MPKSWNLGNTTVRNPHRIADGLAVFAREFEGKISDSEDEAAFTARLHEEGVLTTSGSYGAWLGRKWRSAFHKMGFITGRRPIMTADLPEEKPDLGLKGLEYEVTPSGNRLLEAETLGAIQDVYLRQLVCHQIPSPIEGGFPDGQMKPFIFLLQVLYRLDESGKVGLDKTELATFIQPFRDHTSKEVAETVRRIRVFRKQRAKRDGRVARRDFEKTTLESVAAEAGVKTDTLWAYADTTSRYTRMTGLLGMQGNRLGPRVEKMDIIKAILAEEPLFREDDLEYLYEFYRGTHLPTDEVSVSLKEVRRLRQELKTLSWPIPPELQIVDTGDIKALKDARHRLQELLIQAREEEYAEQQRSPERVREIVKYLDELGKSRPSVVDPPSYLEWAVWRALLAIDHIVCPIHETRRFEIDDEMEPRGTAPGGGPDLIVEFEDFVVVVEVTLTRSSRQIAAEGEPVRRHVAQIQKETHKPVYGLFIAPTIDNNTAEVFRIGVWYWGDEKDYLHLVPLPLGQFRRVIELLAEHPFEPGDLIGLLDKCLTYRHQEAPKWKSQIESAVDNWLSSLGQAA